MDDELTERAQALVAEAKQRWPRLDLRPHRLAEGLRRRAVEGGVTLDELAGIDVCLAVACQTGDPVAIAAFEREIIPAVDGPLRRLGLDDAEVEEAKQRTRASVLVRDGDRAPRVAAYGGTGTLRAWTRAVAVREGQRVRRRRRPVSPLSGASQPDPGERGEAEDVHLRALYRDAVSAAIVSGVRSLPAKERALLSAYYIGGSTLRELAAKHEVHEATIHRWLARARRIVSQHTRERLAEDLQAGPTSTAGLISLMRTQLYVSLTSALHGE